jgi:hypothetical protein
MKDKGTFWVINISDRNVSLADLNVTIPAFASVNLLSKNHYLTEEQLNKSLTSGSIFAKRDKIKKRVVPPPEKKKEELPIDREAVRFSNTKSVFEIKQEKYEDLGVSEDDFAAQNADTVELDRLPLISKK